jgi:hypothetical protein
MSDLRLAVVFPAVCDRAGRGVRKAEPMWVGACSACLCGQTALTPGADAKQTTPFSSNQTECEQIVDAMTPLTPGVMQKATRP